MKYLLISALFFVGFGCSMTKDMDEMHDATNQMNQKMDTTNQGMATMTDQTNELYVDQRQGFSDQIRHQFLDALEKAPTFMAKISEAGQYFLAYEFQLYKHFGSDTPAKLDSLYDQAVEEFFRTFRRYIDDKYAIDPSHASDRMEVGVGDASTQASTNDQNRMLNAAALAVMMYRVNLNLQNDTRVLPSEKISMQDLIEQGLDLKTQLDSGAIKETDLKEWQREVLRHETDAYYALQLRTTFVPAIVLGDISDIADVNILTKGLRMLKSWDNDLSQLTNVEQIVTNTAYMKDANTQVAWLLAHRVDPRIDSTIMKIFKNMNVTANMAVPPGGSTQAQGKARTRISALKDMIAQIEKFRK